jgi:hypothetical protein
MSLPKKIAAMAAPIASIALLLAVPASAQTPDKAMTAAASPKAEANVAAPTSAALPQSRVPHSVRPMSKMQAAGTESGTGKSATVANEPK